MVDADSAREDFQTTFNRRRFLTSVAVAGAVAISAAPATVAAETGTPQDLKHEGGKPGSDFMVDVIKALDINYLPCNPASSFRALHESLIDYGQNKSPEFLTCMHEESAVGMAHGYFKIAGKPLMALVHGTVGLQHAAMGIYNAWCDRWRISATASSTMATTCRRLAPRSTIPT